MLILLISFLLICLAMAGLAMGVMMGRKPLKGSCGGLNAIGAKDCEFCGGNPDKCDEGGSRQ